MAVGERRGQVLNASVGCGCVSVTAVPDDRVEGMRWVGGGRARLRARGRGGKMLKGGRRK